MFAKLVGNLSAAMFTKSFMSLTAAKKIAYLAVFTAIAVVINAVSIDVTPSFKLSFTATVGFIPQQSAEVLEDRTTVMN